MSDIQINPPDLDDVLELLKNNIFANLNCVQIGKIEKVNDNQTVEIMIQVKRRVPNKIISYPLLVDCPYLVLQGGGAYLDFPITKGDYCLVLFNDRNIDTWWKSANVAEPPTLRKHSLSDGFALVGINAETNILDNDGTVVRLLGTSGPGSEEFAARVDDPTLIDSGTDAIFMTWINNVSGAINSLIPGAIPNIPKNVVGIIDSGSTEVKIG